MYIIHIHLLRNVINYHVSIALAIIIGVAVQEYKEYNNLPHGISGTTQCYRNVSNIEYLNLHFSYPDGDDKSARCMLVIDNKQ